MRFGEFYSQTFGWVMKQVNKTTARKLYEQGKTVYVMPCNMRFDNMWQSPCPMNKEREADSTDCFDGRIQHFIYYNCDSERGKYPCYFVKKD